MPAMERHRIMIMREAQPPSFVVFLVLPFTLNAGNGLPKKSKVSITWYVQKP